MTYARGSIKGDDFVVAYNNSGIRQWATYYGGTKDEEGAGITTDALGNVFMTGWTSSTNFPALSGYQMTLAGTASDAFVVKFDGSGTPQWATYYGGGGTDYGIGIAT